jgi:hypothetical protein
MKNTEVAQHMLYFIALKNELYLFGPKGRWATFWASGNPGSSPNCLASFSHGKINLHVSVA